MENHNNSYCSAPSHALAACRKTASGCLLCDDRSEAETCGPIHLASRHADRCHVRIAHINGIQNMPKGIFCIGEADSAWR